MKKHIFGLLAIVALFGACKKSVSGSGSTVPANSWTLGEKTYKAQNVLYVAMGGSSELAATATGGSTSSADLLNFSFITEPTSSQHALITNTNFQGTVLITASHVSGSTYSFYKNGATSVNANITVANGKVGVSFPGAIWLHNLSNENDSLQLTVGAITQN